MIGAPIAENPFPGLRPFEADEGHLFFGREQQIDELLGRLRLRRFVAVVGTSGSGKSSLVRAGLFPALRVGAMSGAGSRWRIVTMMPGNEPLGALARELDREGVLGQEGDAQLRIDLAHAVLDRGGLGLVEIAQQAALHADENLLVVVDQFEELFRYSQLDVDAAAAFVKLLLAASEYPGVPLYVALTMRSDFLGDCAQFADLPERINDGLFLIPRMNRAQLERAIVGPVRVAEQMIAPRLVNQLLNDVGDDPDQLPVLQHALMRTWDIWKADHARNEPLDIPHYEKTGGLKRALDLHAESIYGELPPQIREVARRLFCAITELGSDNRGIRRPVELATARAITRDPDDELRWVIEAFRAPGRSLLKPRFGDELSDRSVVDISHESLMRVWTRLEEWLRDEGASALTYRRLAQDALLHAEGQAALWTDPGLAIAEQWRAAAHPTAEWAERYVKGAFSQAMAFLDDGIAKREQEREREQRRKNAEEAAEREHLENLAVVERMRADAARAVSRRTRIAALAMFAVAVVALVLGGLSWRLRLDADAALRQSQKAQEGTLLANQRMRAANEQRVLAETKTLDTEKAQRKAAQRALGEIRNEHKATIAALDEAQRALRETERQRRLAQYQQDRTKKAVIVATRTANDVVSDVAQRFRDRGVPVDVTRQILSRTQALQRQLMSGGFATPELRESEHGALVEIATTLLEQGDTKSALDAATRSRAIMEGLVAANPRNNRLQSELAASERKAGDVFAARGSLPQARASHRAALAIAARIARAEPRNAGWQHDLAESHEKLGDILYREGSSRDALSEYRAGLAIRVRLATASVQTPAWEHDLAASYGKVGDAFADRDDARDALHYYLEDFAIAKRLADADPNNARRQSDLAVSYRNVGDALYATNDLSKASENYRNALSIAEGLGRKDPGNAAWQSDLSVSQSKIGYVLFYQGHLSESLKYLRDSLAISVRLAKIDANNATWQRDLSTAYFNVGYVLVTQNNYAEALNVYRERFTITGSLVHTDPTNQSWRAELVRSGNSVADVLELRGDPAAAQKLYTSGLDIAKGVAQTDPENVRWQQLLSTSYVNVGYVLLSRGDERKALDLYRAGIAIRKQLADSDPGNTTLQSDLASFYGEFSYALFSHGKMSDALRFYRDDLAIRERVAMTDTGNATLQRNLSGAYSGLGTMLSEQGNPRDGLAYVRKALVIDKRLADSDVSNLSSQHQLSESYSNVAATLKDQDDYDLASEQYREAMTVGERAVASDPLNATWQDELDSVYIGAGDVMALQKKWADALKLYSDSLAIKKRLAEADPGNARWQQALAVGYNRLGNLFYAQSKTKDALSYYREAVAINSRLAESDPTNATLQRDLLIALNNIGDAGDDARNNYTHALTIARALNAQGKLLPKDQPMVKELEKKLADLPN
jgi:tetratricopeptide (TPR) repeat protein